jgi:uncharacterized protein (TIGR01777 family)
MVRGQADANQIAWDPEGGTIDRQGLARVDAVVHLAGVSLVAPRWTESHKRAVIASREKGTSLLSEALAGLGTGPRVLISASAIGFYGDRGGEELDESSASGLGFLADVCRRWEAATEAADKAGVRTVLLRTGIVLSPDGGSLKLQLPLFRAGLGGRLGDGRQWVSWISIDDEVGAILHALERGDVSGPLNAVAPHPVVNAAFTRTLARVVHRPAVMAAPAPVLRLALGRELADETLLVSQRVIPRQLQDSGYTWRHPELEGALRHLLNR